MICYKSWISLNSLLLQEAVGKTYLEKLFGEFQPTLPTDNWLIIILATLFYGQIALALIMWVLFSSSLFGIVFGAVVVGISVAFVRSKRSRPIGLFVLACLNFLLAAGITCTVAVVEGVPPILISLLPTGLLVWLSFQSLVKERLQ